MKNLNMFKVITFGFFVSSFLMFAVVVPRAEAANTCQSNGTGGGAFNLAATWTSCGGVTPAVADTITINTGDTVTLVATTTVAGITINSGGILGANTRTLTDTGIYTNNGSQTSTTSNMTLSGVSGTVINGNGSYTATTGGVIITTGDKTIAVGSQLSFPKLTITTVTATNNSTLGLTVTGALAGTGALTEGVNANLFLSSTSLITTLNATAAGNTVTFNGSGNQTAVKDTTYINLTITSGATATLNGAITVNGNLLITSGIFADGGFQITGNGIGTLTLNAGTTLILGTVATATSFPTVFNAGNISLATTSTVNYNSNVAQNISNIPTYGNLTTTATGAVVKTAAGALTINGNFTNGVNNTFADGGFTITVKGNATMTGTHTGAGKILLTGGSGAHTISGTGSFNNVELNDTNGVTQSAVTNIGGTFTVTSGTWTASNTLAVTGATSISGTLLIGSTTGTKTFNDITINSGGVMSFAAAETVTENGNLLIATGGAMNFTGGAGIMDMLGNLTVNGTGVITGTTGLWTFQKVGGGTIGGTAPSLTILGSTTFATQYSLPPIFTVNTMTVPTLITETNLGTITINTSLAGAGTFVQNSNTVLNLGGTTTVSTLNAGVIPNDVHYTSTVVGQTIKAATYYNLFLDKPGRTGTMSGTTNILGNFMSTADTTDFLSSFVTVTGTTDIFGILKDQNNTGLVTFGGLLTMHSGSSWSGNPGEACDFTFHNGMRYDGGTFIPGVGNFTFDTNNQSITGASSVTIGKVVVTGVQLTNSNTSTVSITSSLSGTGEFIQNTNTVLNISGTSPISILTAIAAGNIVNYNGSLLQTVHAGVYQTLNVSGNTNANVDITADTTANTVLTLGATIFATSTNKMIIGAGATLTRTTGFINGNLQKNVSSGLTAPTFEIGSGADYTPVNLNFHAVATSGNVVVSTTPNDHPNIATSQLFANKTANRFWTVSNLGVGFGTYDATLTFVPTDVDIGANTANLVPALFSSGVWSYPAFNSALPTSITVTGLTSFGDLQIGEPNFPVTQFSLNNPGDMFAGARLGYMVTRKNQFNNPATFGITTVYLYSSSSGANKKFYDAPSGGNIITSIDITDGNSVANFWYFDDAIGTWTITASDNAVAPDGATGIADATDSVTVMPVATKFVIINPTDSVVGNPVVVTVQAEDVNNNIITTYNNNVTFTTSGSATGAGLVNITNGVGTIFINDETAETVSLALSDTQATGLDVTSTQDVVFATGPLFQFAINNPGDTTAGTRAPYTVTRKDQFGNIITSGTNTVFLYTSSASGLGFFYDALTLGNIITSVTIPNGIGTANFWYGEGRVGTFSITVSDNSSAPDGATGVADATDSISVSSGPTSLFLLNDPGGMTAGDRLGYTVIRKDAFNNLATGGTDTVYLYSNSSSPNKAFYDAGIAGNAITSIVILNGVSSANFWYFDDTTGTWTITATDNAVAPDGVAGIIDATDDVMVNTAPVVPTKIVIVNPNDAVAGTPTAVTVRVVDDTGALDTSYNNTVTLNTSGSAIGGGIITITGGIGIVNINDNVAETVNLSLSDTGSTGLDVSSIQDVVFSPGATAQFTINDPGNNIAGIRSPYTVTRKDQFGNLVTSGTNTVYLYTNSLGNLGKFFDSANNGNVMISLNISNGQSSSPFWYEEGKAGNWTVTVSDNNTVPDGATGIADANDLISVSPATTHDFILTDPGNMQVSTRLGYTVTREDLFGNLVTSGPQNIYLYSSSTSVNKAFFGAGIGGSAITFITIPNGLDSADFWYFDDTTGNYTLTTSDNPSSPDGVAGIIDASDDVTVNNVPIVATKLVITSVSNALVGDTVAVIIRAEDNNGNIDSTFSGNVTLRATGSVTGEGVVHIVSGVGTINITDNVADTSILSLSDTANTGLNVDSTQTIIFGSILVVSTSSSGNASITTPTFAIKFSGKASLGSLIDVLGIPTGGGSAQAVILDQQTVTSNDGSFTLSLDNPDSKSSLYVVSLTDKNHIPGQLKVFANVTDVATVNNIVFAPTLNLLRSSIRRTDFLSIFGYANAGSVVEAQFDGTTLAKETTNTLSDGSYKLLVSTNNMSLGKHSVRVRSRVGGKTSDFSLTRSFTLSDIFRPIADLNDDGKVDARDINIFNSDWVSTDPNVRIKLDFNGDGKVDLQDVSIFVQALK